MNKLLAFFLFVVASSHALLSYNNGKADEACTAIGGSCMNWLNNKCIAGYETGLCSGDSNNRCCKNCDQTCQDNEAAWSANDSQCTSADGVCMQNSNYCDGAYSNGKCGGPSTRQCCQKIQGCPKFVTRDEWGARPPRSPPTSIGNNVPYQFVHHSTDDWSCDDEASCKAAVKSIQDYHMDFNGWDDIGYSFLVGGDGNMYEGRGWNVQGAHTSGYNSVGYGTCFIGGFMTENPVQAAQDVYLGFLDCAVNLGKVMPSYQLYGHRQAGSTECPGDSFYRLIQTWPHWTPGSPV